jgi:hypothetical protein
MWPSSFASTVRSKGPSALYHGNNFGSSLEVAHHILGASSSSSSPSSSSCPSTSLATSAASAASSTAVAISASSASAIHGHFANGGGGAADVNYMENGISSQEKVLVCLLLVSVFKKLIVCISESGQY